jgi:UDP-3-O-[3-hydroxymyristoyl] glucosamine N-acyltransferase
MAITTGALARLLEARLEGSADVEIHRPEMADRAGPDDIVFIGAARYLGPFLTSRAGAAIVAEGLEIPAEALRGGERPLLFVADVDAAMAAVLRAFAPAFAPAPAAPGMHPTSIIDATASIGANVSIGPWCTIGPGAVIGDDVMLMGNVHIGAGSRIGRGTVIHTGAVIHHRCTVGQHCTIYAGVVIGADGFGYRPAPDGRGLSHVPHLGTVEIGDHVDVGANTCIDRAKFGATTIGSGTKIDNLVQIAHNCRIGRSCILCGQVGLAGSVVLGDGVVLGGAVAIADHLTLGDGVQVAARSGVMNNIPAGQTWVGLPAAPAAESLRNYAAFRKLGEMMQRLKRYEKMMDLSAQPPPTR